MRKGSCERATEETSVRISIDIDAPVPANIATGYAMFDHLLAQWAFYARAGLSLSAQSFDRIEHHLVEDVAIALGEACCEALGERFGIERAACVVQPMDDALVRCAIDLSGRAYVRVDLGVLPERIEDLSSPLLAHFFQSFGARLRASLHVDRLNGEDPHHVVEAAFKALGRACRAAWARDASMHEIPSTKGCLV